MSSSLTIWIIVAVVVVIIAAVLVGMLASRRSRTRREQARTEAGRLREEAVAGSSSLPSAQADAASARAEAERTRAEAEAAEQRAREKERGLAAEEADVEGKVREADRLDPDVDHRSRSYTPNTPFAEGSQDVPEGPADRTTPAGTTARHAGPRTDEARAHEARADEAPAAGTTTARHADHDPATPHEDDTVRDTGEAPARRPDPRT